MGKQQIMEESGKNYLTRICGYSKIQAKIVRDLENFGGEGIRQIVHEETTKYGGIRQKLCMGLKIIQILYRG